jgi:secreted trypsin-like serine protease
MDHPEVVLLETFRADGGLTVCSGTVFAPKAVLTAAHCLQVAVFVQVYWGNDYFGDFEQLFTSPEPENFRFSIETNQHPHYNTDDLRSDVGVVHVDRDFPFKPMKLAWHHVSHRRIGDDVEIVGWGVSEPDDTNAGGLGAYFKRSGTTEFEGTPRRWPLPPNPHPGLTNRRVRKQLMQLDGSDTNACFGDSGGPAIMKIWGHKRVVGVMSWTGDFCEDFSYYTRINKVLPFIMKQAVRAYRGEAGT